mgnify:CR=1 FL=1
MFSVFDIFKVSIGPSSSHTMGPMIAGKHFRDLVANEKNITRIEVKLYGSLAFTGKAHRSEKGIALIPNFSAGAAFQKVFSEQLSNTFKNVHIVVKHHSNKEDAPSGTSKDVASIVS